MIAKSINIFRNKVVLIIALLLGFSYSAQAQFASPLQLSDINGSNGFVINGESAADRSGYSVSSAGDVNADGIGDILIGAYSRLNNNNNKLSEAFTK